MIETRNQYEDMKNGNPDYWLIRGPLSEVFETIEALRELARAAQAYFDGEWDQVEPGSVGAERLRRNVYGLPDWITEDD